MHYRDECDEDSERFTDPQPEVVESTCVWLGAQQEWEDEAAKAQVRERGLMVGWRDGVSRDREWAEVAHDASPGGALRDREQAESARESSSGGAH